MAKEKMVNMSNLHAQYSDLTTQHWHPNSETYAGGDNLITALERNWQIDAVKVTRHWYAGRRSIRVYEFTISKEERTLIMRVLDNPYVLRFILDEKIQYTVEEDAGV